MVQGCSVVAPRVGQHCQEAGAHHVSLLASQMPRCLDATPQVDQVQGSCKAGAAIKLILYEALKLCPVLGVL